MLGGVGQIGRVGGRSRLLGTTAPVVAPAVTQRVSLDGDSWVAANEAVISRNGPSTPVNTDSWPYQLSQLFSPVADYFTLGVFAGGAAATSTVTTSSAWDLVISGQKVTSAADTLTLDSYTVLICYGA